MLIISHGFILLITSFPAMILLHSMPRNGGGGQD